MKLINFSKGGKFFAKKIMNYCFSWAIVSPDYRQRFEEFDIFKMVGIITSDSYNPKFVNCGHLDGGLGSVFLKIIVNFRSEGDSMEFL